jgi:hypothetical protein
VLFAETLDEATRNSIFGMFEKNMRTMYTASSFGWNPPHKKGELFDPLSRFILVYPKNDKHSLVAFTAFRFEFEEDQNMLYWSLLLFRLVSLSQASLPAMISRSPKRLSVMGLAGR